MSLPDIGHLHHDQVGEDGAVPLHAVIEDNLDQVKVIVKVEINSPSSSPVLPSLQQHRRNSSGNRFEAKNYEAPGTKCIYYNMQPW